MTDLSTSNGAAATGAGDLPMSDTPSKPRKATPGDPGGSFDSPASSFDPPSGASALFGSSAAGPTSASSVSGDDQSRLRASLQAIESRADDMRRWAMSQQDTAREVIEHKPLVVVASAFGIGLVLGLLASRV